MSSDRARGDLRQALACLVSDTHGAPAELRGVATKGRQVGHPLDAAKGILNGVALGAILWALVIAVLFYGFRITL